MDSLNQQLNQFLSDPNSMRQLQGMLNNLGLGQSQGEAPAPEAPPASSPGPDLSALAGALGALGGGGNASESAASGLGGLNPNALTMATKLAPLLGQMNQEDDATRLLRALRPLLSPARQKRLMKR